jgi:hypothetical protein
LKTFIIFLCIAFSCHASQESDCGPYTQISQYTSTPALSKNIGLKTYTDILSEASRQLSQNSNECKNLLCSTFLDDQTAVNPFFEYTAQRALLEFVKGSFYNSSPNEAAGFIQEFIKTPISYGTIVIEGLQWLNDRAEIGFYRPMICEILKNESNLRESILAFARLKFLEDSTIQEQNKEFMIKDLFKQVEEFLELGDREEKGLSGQIESIQAVREYINKSMISFRKIKARKRAFSEMS